MSIKLLCVKLLNLRKMQDNLKFVKFITFNRIIKFANVSLANQWGGKGEGARRFLFARVTQTQVIALLSESRVYFNSENWQAPRMYLYEFSCRCRLCCFLISSVEYV